MTPTQMPAAPQPPMPPAPPSTDDMNASAAATTAVAAEEPPPLPPPPQGPSRGRSSTGDGAYNMKARADDERAQNRDRSRSSGRTNSKGGSGGALRDRSNSRSRLSSRSDDSGRDGDVNSRLYAAALERQKKQEMRQSTYLEKEVRLTYFVRRPILALPPVARSVFRRTNSCKGFT